MDRLGVGLGHLISLLRFTWLIPGLKVGEHPGRWGEGTVCRIRGDAESIGCRTPGLLGIQLGTEVKVFQSNYDILKVQHVRDGLTFPRTVWG